MKAVILSILLATALSATSIGQEYVPFDLDSAEWVMMEVFPAIGPTDNFQYWRLYTSGDTIIEGEQYRLLYLDKLCKEFYDFMQNPLFKDEFLYDDFAIGGLREEGKQLFFYKFAEIAGDPDKFETGYLRLDEDEEHLLYDFNIAEGDTVVFPSTFGFEIINSDTSFFEIEHFTLIFEPTTTIDDINGFNVSPDDAWGFPNPTGVWLEGRGSSFGLFGSYHSLFTRLICFKQNGEIVEDGNCEPCEGITGVSDPVEETGIQIFPNPAEFRMNISLENEVFIDQITVYDTRGKTVLSRHIQSVEALIALDVSSLPAGVYHLRIRVQDGSDVIRKFVRL